MNRRQFLRNGAVMLAGAFMGTQTRSPVWAGQNIQHSPLQSPRIALIIDDIGYSTSRLRAFLSLNLPLTFSILPRLPKTHELGLDIHENGHEIMLHQPMEPYDQRKNPGPGALYVGDKKERIIDVIRENFETVPFAEGMNNHMGSRFTSSGEDIHWALSTLQSSGLFFIDSMTSGRSVAYHTARSLRITTARRQTFLDNDRDVGRILKQLSTLKSHAVRDGKAIGIGHPFPETVEGIDRFMQDPRNADISLVHISKLLEHPLKNSPFQPSI